MGIFWNMYRKMLPPDAQQMLAWIESEVSSGRMSDAEAEQRRAELENTLHKIFDSEDSEKKDAE